MVEQRPELADGTPGAIAVRNGGLTPSDPGAAAESLAFNAFVRRSGERTGRLSFPLRGGIERGGVDPLSRGLARYPRARRRREALSRVSAGSPRARRRLSRGFEGVRMGCTVFTGRGLGFFESFPFLWIGGRLQAFVGPIA